MDYYKLLGGLRRDCDDSAIKLAYRKMSLKYHPAKHSGADLDEATTKFREISEAFEVLSDPRKRAIFDQCGEKGLKEGVPDGLSGIVTKWSFSKNPQEMFSDVFGQTSPFVEFFGTDAGASTFFADTAAKAAPQAEAIEQNLYCSLEELFAGCTKKQQIVRSQLNSDGVSSSVIQKFLDVEVHAGWRAGTKLTFQGEGDEMPGAKPGDVVLVLKEKPHPRFTRTKHDLHHTANITLEQALVGCTVEIATLDGRILPIAVSEIVRPDKTHVVNGEGMPIPGQAGARGDLIIHFNIQFPEMLSNGQKEAISHIMKGRKVYYKNPNKKKVVKKEEDE